MDQPNAFRIYLLKQGQEESTIRTNLKLLRRVLLECTPLSSTSFSSFLDSLILQGKTASYIRQYVYVLRHYGRFLDLPGFPDFPMPKIKHKTTFIRGVMNKEEIDTFINLPYPFIKKGDFEKRWYMWSIFWLIQAWTGMRPAEVSRLTINDIDFGLEIFRVRKTKIGEARVIPINEVIMEQVKDYVQGIGIELLFPQREKQKMPVTISGWEENFLKRIKIMGIKREGLVPYSLRHSFPSRLIKTTSIYDIKELMGHKKITTTEKYLHTDLDSLRETVNSDPLGELHKTGEDQLQDILKLLRKIEEKYSKTIYGEIRSEENGIEVTATFKVRGRQMLSKNKS